MLHNAKFFAAMFALSTAASLALAQPSTSTVTYQGVLTQNGAPVADGTYPLVFKIYDAAVGGNPLQTINVPGVPTTEGRFSAAVPVSPSSFNGADRWWSVTFGGTELPRQKVTAVPYAMSTRGLAVSSEGHLGVGTLTPRRVMHIDSGSQNATLVLGRSANGATNKWVGVTCETGSGDLALQAFDDSVQVATQLLWLKRNGYVGVGTSSPQRALHVDGGPNNATIVLGRSLNPSGNRWSSITCEQGSGDVYISAFVDQVLTASHLMVLRRDGLVSVRALQITGADVAEKFDVAPTHRDAASTLTAHPVPGMVVSIDPANPGKLMIAAEAYDKKVAGIISGANGLDAGVILGQDNKSPYINGEHPVAMTGRVWVFADDSNGPIIPGDRLTSSGIKPGHAMKALDESKAPGAVIGKAMTPRDDKTGMALVLVNLQ